MQHPNATASDGDAILRRLGWFAPILAALVASLALLALGGWATRHLLLASFGAALIPMAPGTALSLLALGAAIVALARWPGHPMARRVVWGAALALMVAPALILPRALFGVGPDIEHWLYREPTLFMGVPLGRMSPLTALGLLLAGLALLGVLTGRPRASNAAVGLATAAGALGFVGLLGYSYGTPLLYGGALVPMALSTAVALTLASLGLLAAIGARAPLLRALAGPSMTARLLRAFLPGAGLLALVHFGGNMLLQPFLHVQDAMLRAALVSVGATLALAVVVALIARQIGGALDRAEGERRRAMHRLQAQVAITTAINRLLQGALQAETDEAVAQLGLAEAERLTGSQFGWVGEVNAVGRLDIIALSDPGWAACAMSGQTMSALKDRERKGIYGRVLQDGAPVIANNPSAHPDWCGLPSGHPALTSFLGVPLWQEGRLVGMIALGNKAGGYGPADQETIATLSVALVAALQRKRIEQTLAEERTLLRTLVDHLPDAIFAKDTTGRTTLSNPADARLLGCTSEAQVLGKTVYELYPPERAAAIDADDHKVLFSGQPALNREVSMVHPGGASSWQLVSKVPLRDASGRVIGMLGISHDITARKQAAEALRASEERFRSLYENATVGLYRTTPDGRILLANPAAVHMLGFDSFAELAQRNLEQVGYAPSFPRAAFRRQIEATGAVIGLESAWQRRDGAIIYVRESAQAVRDAAGQVVYYDGTFEDITARKQAEDRLQRTLADLKRSNADLEQFAYAASHDLQEPLRMVASYVQLLQMRYQGQLDADADEFIGFAVDGARRMQQLIVDLLEFSRVGTRGQPFQPVAVGAVVTDALWNLQLASEESGATVTHDLLPTVIADATQLTQLFQNLIGNAIKFRGKEPPRVHITAEHITVDGAPVWQFAVRDNGIGIAPEHCARIFGIFQRLHTRADYPGTGIGLAVCQRIVERHGGRIWAESQPGQGATFYFTLPAAS